MKNIIFARVDDRLIHGEVVTEWLPVTASNHIVVVDDAIANDSFTKRLIQLIAPKHTTIHVFSIQEAIEYLSGEFLENERIMILMKSPTTMLALCKGRIEIKQLNIGGMGLFEGRKLFYKNIACSDEEIASIKELIMFYKVTVYYQLVPEQQFVDLSSKLFKNQ